MLPLFANHTITIESPGKKTVHGNPVDDWSTSTTRTIDYCWVESASLAATEENTYRRDTTRAGFDILIPLDAVPPNSDDRIYHPLREGAYMVKGEAMPSPSPSGIVDHWFVYAERWKVNGT